MQQVGTRAWHTGKVAERPGKLASAHRKPKLLDRMREAMRSRHCSRSTRQSYWNRVKRFIFFHNVLNRGGRVVRSPVDCL